jgi:hypothetical protein
MGKAEPKGQPVESLPVQQMYFQMGAWSFVMMGQAHPKDALVSPGPSVDTMLHWQHGPEWVMVVKHRPVCGQAIQPLSSMRSLWSKTTLRLLNLHFYPLLTLCSSGAVHLIGGV